MLHYHNRLKSADKCAIGEYFDGSTIWEAEPAQPEFNFRRIFLQNKTQHGHWFALLLLSVSLGSAATALTAIHPAAADYTPPSGPYGAVVVGANGSKLIDDSTALDPYDIAGYWNLVTQFERLSVPSGPSDCGLTEGCTLIDTAGTSLIGSPSCTVPTPTYNADLRVSSDSFENTGCPGMGTDYNPVFLIDYSYGSSTTYIGRHEMGHALGLHEAPQSCYTENSLRYPVMNNGLSYGCSNWGTNINATANEVAAVISRNGWF